MMIKEQRIRPLNGWLILALHSALVAGAAMLIIGIGPRSIALGVIMALASVIAIFGYMAIQPNNARVLLLFGAYRGSVVESGFFWTNPLYSKIPISLRVRNFETGSTTVSTSSSAATPMPNLPMGSTTSTSTSYRSAGKPSKVNDRDGNPIEISAVVVWRVVDTAEAVFEVDDFEDFVAVQSESALRSLASRHPYDNEDSALSLRGSTEEISDQLRGDIQARLDKAGVDVIEARISHLAYAPEIAAAMLQRQQAKAIVAARGKIVEGAVSMVRMALEQLAEQDIVTLDDERRARMVANLLVVLCSDHHAQPVISTGSG